MPLGFNILPTLGRLSAETVIGYVKGTGGRPLEHGYNFLSAFLGAIVPIGGGNSVIQTISPTVLDPVAGIFANEDWTGRNIYQEDLDKRNPTPGHTRARDTATIWAEAISRGINWATGGNEYRPGLASPTPDAIDYVIGQATGGVGRELSKMQQLTKGTITGEAVPIYKVPVFGRFVGSASGPASVRDRYYETVKQVNMDFNELKGRMKASDVAEVYLQNHPKAALHQLTASTEHLVTKLRGQKDLLVSQGAPRDAVKLIDEQILSIMKRVNEAYATSSRTP